MIEKQIEELRQELNKKVDNGIRINEVYELSVRLDNLIAVYYNEARRCPPPL